MLHCTQNPVFAVRCGCLAISQHPRHGSFLSHLHIFQFGVEWMPPIAPVDMMLCRPEKIKSTQCTVRGHFGVFQRVSLCHGEPQHFERWSHAIVMSCHVLNHSGSWKCSGGTLAPKKVGSSAPDKQCTISDQVVMSF